MHYCTSATELTAGQNWLKLNCLSTAIQFSRKPKMIAMPNAVQPCIVDLRVVRGEKDNFGVYADGVQVASYETRYQAGAHCMRLYAQNGTADSDQDKST
jgi:hypothetical protein